jgi:Ca2+-binding EF-hand superfamily protein
MQRALLAVMVTPALAMALGAGGNSQPPEHRPLGFERLDRNGDGYLTRRETLGLGPDRLMDHADADGDGRLDKGELNRFMQGLPRRRG